MNRLTYFLVCLVSVWACHSTGSVTPNSLAPVQPTACTGVKLERGERIIDLDTRVIALTFVGDDGVGRTAYFLDKPEADVPKLYYNACNLPDSYKQDQLRVRINGYRYVVPPNANTVGVPIELTSIEVIPEVN